MCFRETDKPRFVSAALRTMTFTNVTILKLGRAEKEKGIIGDPRRSGGRLAFYNGLLNKPNLFCFDEHLASDGCFLTLI